MPGEPGYDAATTTNATESVPTDTIEPAGPAGLAGPPTTTTIGRTITLRSPSHSKSTSPADAPKTPPAVPFLQGTWHVTHSTLPMWKGKRNVRITYTPLSPAPYQKSVSGLPRIDDLVEYQSLKGSKWKSVKGIDTPFAIGGVGAGGNFITTPTTSDANANGNGQFDGATPAAPANGAPSPTSADNGEGWAWQWRGKGWLKIASSKWEVLGYGGASNTTSSGGDSAENGEEWVVTYFAATMFTPAGIDVYARNKRGLSIQTLDGIKAALARIEDDGVKKLAGEIFEITMDDVESASE